MLISDWSSDVCSSDLQVGHFAERMLRLRDRHAVTGNDDDIFGLAHQEGGVFGAARLPRALFLRRAAARARIGAETAGDHADEAAIHRAAHAVRSEERRVGKEGVSTGSSRGSAA